MKYYIAHSANGVSHWVFPSDYTEEEVIAEIEEAIEEEVSDLERINKKEYYRYENLI